MHSMQETDFEKIPFRVVVTKILTFHNIYISRWENEFENFGYFKRDVTRRIFFLFMNISNLNESYFTKKQMRPIMSIQNLIYLDMDCLKQKYMDIISKAANKFKSLESIHIYANNESSSHYNLFCESGCFPKLKKLNIMSEVTVNTTEWHKSEHIWKNLEVLSLYSDEIITLNKDNNIFNQEEEKGFLKNLKLLSFQDSGVEDSNFHVILSLPSIKGLFLSSPYFVDVMMMMIQPLENNLPSDSINTLKNVSVKGCREILSKKLLVHPSIETYEYYPTKFENEEPRKCDWLFKEKLNFVDIGLGRVELPIDGIIPLGEKVEVLKIENCTNLNLSTFTSLDPKKKHPKLRKLVFRNFNNHQGGKSLPFSTTTTNNNVIYPVLVFDHISSLELCYCDGIDDSFFQNNKWSNLKKIYLDHINVSGKSWSEMPKLKEILIRYCRRISDDLFTDDDENHEKDDEDDDDFPMTRFPVLESVEFFGCNALLGREWNTTMEHLKFLKVSYCQGFSGEVFQAGLRIFPTLRVLNLEGLKSLDMKKNWSMKQIVELNIVYTKFTDSVFQGEGLLNLRILDLYMGKYKFQDEKKKKKIDWVFMPKLVSFIQIRHCNNNGGGEEKIIKFEENDPQKPFPDSTGLTVILHK